MCERGAVSQGSEAACERAQTDKRSCTRATRSGVRAAWPLANSAFGVLILAVPTVGEWCGSTDTDRSIALAQSQNPRRARAPEIHS